jgi:predicted RNase H-like HicB family nuclease
MVYTTGTPAPAAAPYLRAIERGEDGVFTAWLVEMPNVIAEGDTADEALENLEDALEGVVAVLRAEGREVPQPIQSREYSGRLQLRIPPSLHRRAAIRAEVERVSLNRVFSDAIAQYLGVPAPAASPRYRAVAEEPPASPL